MEALRDLLLQVRNRLSSSSRRGQSIEMILSAAEESLGLLGTNDGPIRTEELLRGPLNQCQTLLCQKRQEMADLRCRLGVLDEEERDLVNIAEKTKGLFSYIRHCPPEVIREIFLNCVDFYHSTDKPEDDFHDSVRARLIHPDNAPFLLLRICKKWRQIALDTPKLFTQLYLSHEMIEGEEETDSVLHLFLTCSGSLPLDIFLQAKTHHHFSFGRMDMVGAQLSPCFPRIYRIRMPWEFLPRLFPPDSCTDAPALLDFRLYGDGMLASDSQFGRLVAPKLEVFSSPLDLNFDWEGFITFGECLKMFSGCHIFEKLHQLFQNSSNMEYCRIVYYIENPESELEYDAPIFLPRLRDLSISTSSKIGIPLLSQLMMPSLHTLQLDDIFNCGDETTLGGIISSFNSARPPLETLFIGGDLIEREEFIDLMRILPELTTMILSHCDINDTLADFNLYYKPDVCPKLAILDLTGSCFDYSNSIPIGGTYEDSSRIGFDIIDTITSRACPRRSKFKDPEERTPRCLRYINVRLTDEDIDYDYDRLEKIRELGDEYHIVIMLEGREEEENESEHSDGGTPSDFQ